MSINSSTLTYSTPVPSNGSSVFYCGNNGIIDDSFPVMPPGCYYECGREYESALATLTKPLPKITYSADMPTTSDTILYCGYSSTIDPTKNNRSAVDYWNCGRTFARNYALSDALSLKPTNALQYFIFSLFIACIFL